MATTNVNGEIFGRKPISIVAPITADMCTILWGKDNDSTAATALLGATNVNISYQQQVVRRRTLAAPSGHPISVIYPTQPIGSIQIQRLYADLTKQAGTLPNGATAQTESIQSIFNLSGWNICNGTATLKIAFDGESAYKHCSTKGPGYRATGAVVTGYNLSAEAEGLTVVDNVAIEFMQLFLEQ